MMTTAVENCALAQGSPSRVMKLAAMWEDVMAGASVSVETPYTTRASSDIISMNDTSTWSSIGLYTHSENSRGMYKTAIVLQSINSDEICGVRLSLV